MWWWMHWTTEVKCFIFPFIILDYIYYRETATTTTTWYSRRNVGSEKSELQMGFEPTTLRDLVGCSNHWATGDSVVNKGHVVGMTGTASRGYTAMYLAHMNSLTASCCHIKAYQDASNQPPKWICYRNNNNNMILCKLEHPTRSRRVVGSNPIWGSDFFESLFLLEFT